MRMTSEETIGQRILETINHVHDQYDRAAESVRTYVPIFVTITELLLALALFAMLALWFLIYLG